MDDQKSSDKKESLSQDAEEKMKRIEKMFDNLIKHIEEESYPRLEKKM